MLSPHKFGIRIIFEENGFKLEHLAQCDNTLANIKDTITESLSLVLALVDKKDEARKELLEKIFINVPGGRKNALRLGYLILNEFTTRGDETALFVLSVLVKSINPNIILLTEVKEKKFVVNRNYSVLLSNGDKDKFRANLLVQYPGISKQINTLFGIDPPEDQKNQEALQMSLAENRQGTFFAEPRSDNSTCDETPAPSTCVMIAKLN
jgi:hypothetical protein